MHEEKVVVLSTSHISEADNNALLQMDRHSEHYHALWSRGYGYMMHVGLMRNIAAQLEPSFESLDQVLQYAHTHDVDWLLLDADGETTEELTTYEW